MAADAFPLDNAVNNADEKILHPENRKLDEKMQYDCQRRTSLS